MDDLFDDLEDRIPGHPRLFVFNPPASEGDIIDFETRNECLIPSSYKQFLLKHNGGYISDLPANEAKDPAYVRKNANVLLSLQEMEAQLSRLSAKVSGDETLFIPMCYTRSQELLVFKNPLKNNESPIFDAWHEADPEAWENQVVYEDFRDLFVDYLQYRGNISIVG